MKGFELKSCPFCGGEAELVAFYIRGAANRKKQLCEMQTESLLQNTELSPS